MAISRVPGYSLLANLDRQGTDLYITSTGLPVTYWDVVNYRFGINNSLPQQTLDVTGNIITSNGHVYTGANISFDVGQITNWWRTVYSQTITSAYLTGTLLTNAQPNITSLGTLANVTVSGNVITGNITGNGLSLSGYGVINTTGNIIGAAATFSSTTVNGLINTTGNVLATGGVFNALTVNGNETVTGYLNVTGNVLGAAATFSSATVNGLINTSGNILAATHSGGSVSVTGLINTAGNVLSTGLRVFGNTSLGLAGAISGSWTTVVGNITQTTSGGPVYFNTIGNVLAATGIFSAINSAGYINSAGNISTPQLNAGQINTTGNVLATGGIFNSLIVNGTINSTGNILSTGAIHNYLDVNGNVDLGLAGAISGSWINVIGNITQSSSGGAVYINTSGNVLASTGTFNNLTVNSNITATNGWVNAGTVNVSGNVLASRITTSNLVANGSITTANINATGELIIQSLTGGNITLNASGAGAVIIAGTDAVGIPIGNTAQRPTTVLPGYTRYNTETTAMEVWDGSIWQALATTSALTGISSQTITPNGASASYTLSSNATVDGVLVSINGTLQQPTAAYTIGGDKKTITFSEIPLATDIIEVRYISGGLSSVSSLQLGTSNVAIPVADQSVIISTAGNIVLEVNRDSALVSSTPNVFIASSGVATTIDSYDAAKYRTAKYILQAEFSTGYQSMEILVTHDGVTSYRTVYGVIDTNGSVGSVSTTLSSGNVNVQYTATNNNTTVRLVKHYLVI